jgi:hypothetical protein
MSTPAAVLVPLLSVSDSGFEVFDAATCSRVKIRAWCCERRGQEYYLRGTLIVRCSDTGLSLVQFPDGKRVWCEPYEK